MKSPVNLNQKLYRFNLKHLILIIVACIVLGIIIGGQNPLFFGRYYLWLFILFLILIAKPVHRWLTTREMKRKYAEDNQE